MVQPDMKNAGVFLGFCANPGISSYLMNVGLQANHRRGMKVIIIDPRITPASQSADLHLRVKARNRRRAGPMSWPGADS